MNYKCFHCPVVYINGAFNQHLKNVNYKTNGKTEPHKRLIFQFKGRFRSRIDPKTSWDSLNLGVFSLFLPVSVIKCYCLRK